MKQIFVRSRRKEFLRAPLRADGSGNESTKSNRNQRIPVRRLCRKVPEADPEVVIPYQYSVLNDKAQDTEKSHVIQNFVNALQKGMDYVQSHTPEEIAKAIEPQFPESDLETITTIVTRYYDQDTWKENLIFEKSSFELLQDILESAGELEKRAPYEDLVTTTYAETAVK